MYFLRTLIFITKITDHEFEVQHMQQHIHFYKLYKSSYKTKDFNSIIMSTLYKTKDFNSITGGPGSSYRVSLQELA